MPPRKVPSNEVLVEMYGRPMSAGQIAKELDMNINTIASALSRIPGLVLRNQSEAQKLAFQNGKKTTSFWKGKKQPKDMVERRVSKIRGENHYLWKGGSSIREYRKLVSKEKCENCGSRLNLCVHHLDFDHYNNNPDNLSVLCVHCHLSLHKSKYWNSIRKGEEPMKSTAKSNWLKGGDD
jgi:hypothetical protein